MSDHDWVLEHLASYTAGGLSGEERERLERHTTDCASCGQALQELRAMDQTLETLFKPVRPGPALEDRMIRLLRTKSLRRWRWPFPAPIAVGAAAVVLLGVVGGVLSNSLENGMLPFPGAANARMEAVNNLKQLGLALSREGDANLWNDLGSYPPAAALVLKGGSRIHTNIGGGLAAPQDVDEMAQQLRNKALDLPLGVIRAPARGAMTSSGGDSGGSPAADLGRLQSSRNGSVRAEVGGETLRETAEYSYRAAGPQSQSASAAPPAGGMPGMGMGTAGGGFGGGSGWGRSPGGGPGMPAGTSASIGGPAAPGSGPSLTYKVIGDRVENKSLQLDYFKPGVAFGDQGKDRKARAGDAPKDVKAQFLNAPGNSEVVASLKPAQPQPPAAAEPAAPRKIIIRSGDLEFEIDSFDNAVATVMKLVGAIPGGFVATINSDKLPNGKVKGSVAVRVPPERLDALVLDLRKELGKIGELKTQRIGSQDITKQYTDLESRLRAARTMEERLLQIIKTGKGEIKDLLLAEKELGVWRTKIEELEGELRYYGNLVSLSTLTITLYEKEIRAPSVITEIERVNMGVEVEDVDKAQQAVVAAVAAAKGRITKAEMKQQSAGQFNALIHFEVAPEQSGPIRDRLRQLGNVARLDIDRVQQAQDGSGPAHDAKSRRAETQFVVSLYNLINVAPRETVTLTLAAVDAEAAYRLILARVQKTTGRVITSNLNRQRNEQSGTLQFEVPTAEAEAVLAELKTSGEVLRLQITENPDTQNVTRSKRGFVVQVLSLWQVQPRELATLTVATKDVPRSYRLLLDAVNKATGRIHNAQLNEQDKQNVSGTLDFEVRRVDEATIDAALAKAGEVVSRNVQRAQDSENVTDSKVRLQLTLLNQARLQPRETVVLGIEVANVEEAVAVLTGLAHESQGEVVNPQVTRERSGRVTARLTMNVPLSAAAGLVEKAKNIGTVRVQQMARNPQAPEGALALARLEVTLSNVELIVPSDEGVWPQIRKSLQYSVQLLLWSLSFVILGVCVVLPWAVVVYAFYRLIVWLRRKPGSTPTTA